jgi:hypothetical protein
MNSDEILKRMTELMGPIDKQIMMCDDNKELLMFACAMLQRVTEIFDQELGVNGRKRMLEDLIK